MNVPSDWPLLVIAVLAAALSIDAGANLALALPPGLVAVVAAGLLLAGSTRRMAWHRAPAPRMAPPTATSTLRTSFRAGRAGRRSIVSQLDQIERRGPHPEMQARTEQEEERIHRMPRSEFREYVRCRLDTIEAADR